MAEPTSVTTLVMGEQLPWPEDLLTILERGPFDSGAIFHSGVRRDCEIKKISALGVTVRSDLEPALGERVTVELPTGQRAAGKVAWTRNSQLGVRFDDSIDVVALLNRKLVSQSPDRRTMPRLEVRCTAHIKNGEHFTPAVLRNISARGLQLEGDELPAIGTFVSVFVEGLSIPSGEVMWRQDKLGGVELFEDLSWTSIVPWVRSVMRNSTN